jgi:hypothetical protein
MLGAGGAVRDYFSKGYMTSDVDFEDKDDNVIEYYPNGEPRFVRID